MRYSARTCFITTNNCSPFAWHNIATQQAWRAVNFSRQ